MNYYKLDENNNIISKSQDVKDFKHYQDLDELYYYDTPIYYVDNGQVVERTQTELNNLTEDEIVKENFEQIILPILSCDLQTSYGSYGSLGSLCGKATGLLSASGITADDIDEIIYEMRDNADIVNFTNSSNIRYHDNDIINGEKGCIVAIDPTKDVIIETNEICTKIDGSIMNTYYIALVSLAIEYGYQLSDITVKYKKGTGNWLTATPRLKKPFSVFTKIEDTRTGNIKLRLELTAGNNDTSKHFAFISFALIGV